MHCCGGVFFFICPRQPGRPGSRLDWAGIGWRDTAFWCNDLIRPRGFTGAFVASLFFPITWLEAEEWLVQRAVGSTADEFVG